MPFTLTLSDQSKHPKYKQIITAYVDAIEGGQVAVGEKLPSINELSIEHLLSRDTVEKAYKVLKEKGYLTSVPGKGYFAERPDKVTHKVALIMNKLSTHKKRVYQSLLAALPEGSQVDLLIFHHEFERFAKMVKKIKGDYNHYVVMPHFHNYELEDVKQVLLDIPAHQLTILDRRLESVPASSCIYQLTLRRAKNRNFE